MTFLCRLFKFKCRENSGIVFFSFMFVNADINELTPLIYTLFYPSSNCSYFVTFLRIVFHPLLWKIKSQGFPFDRSQKRRQKITDLDMVLLIIDYITLTFLTKISK